MAPRKKPKPLPTAEALLARGNAEISAHVVRRQFESTHADRMRGVGDMPVGRESTRTIAESGISPKMAYHLMGLHGQEPATPHPAGQPELPGMEHRRAGIESGLIPAKLGHDRTTGAPMHALPDLAPAPTRWEHMTDEARSRTLAEAQRFGVTPDSMHHSFAAQLDQGHVRAAGHGMTPYATHFYSGGDPDRVSKPEEMQPRDRLDQSARENKVPFSTQVLANAKTSPKAKFRQVSASTGEVRYPNDEAANVAIQGVKSGMLDEQITKPHGLQVTNTNIRLAAHGVRQHLSDIPMDEVRNPSSKSSPQGSAPFGPKTGPYANSFIDPHGSSQFFVSDVHSGGAGMAPHIPHEAPFKRTATGEISMGSGGRPQRSSSQREDYLDIPGIHALHDHVARQVMHERGLNSLSGVQATQWGEEQVSRAEVDRGARKVTLVSEKDAYPDRAAPAHVHGQMDLFGGPAVGERHQFGGNAKPANTVEMPEGRERVAAEAKAAAIHRNVARKRGIPDYHALGNEPHEGWG